MRRQHLVTISKNGKKLIPLHRVSQRSVSVGHIKPHDSAVIKRINFSLGKKTHLVLGGISSHKPINPNQVTENMEVHHHPQHQEKKNWKSYFWEFLMLFLAVFCGFLAENLREHIVEHDREKRYIENLYEDLKKDSTSIQTELRLRKSEILFCGSLIRELGSPDSLAHPASIYYHAYSITSSRLFASSSTTISELRNSGSMRLIRKTIVIDSVNNYYIEVDRYTSREQLEQEIMLEYRKAISNFLDGAVLMDMADSTSNVFGYIQPANNVSLLTTDVKIINPIKNLAAQLDYRNKVNMLYLKRLLRHNNYLMELIKKEYELN
jgi:hypothetical protein